MDDAALHGRLAWWVLAAGVVGAVAYPGWHTGVGWLVMGVVVAAVVLVARRGRKALTDPTGTGPAGSVAEPVRAAPMPVGAPASAGSVGWPTGGEDGSAASSGGSSGRRGGTLSDSPGRPGGTSAASAAGSTAALGAVAAVFGRDAVLSRTAPAREGEEPPGTGVVHDRYERVWRLAAGLAALVLLAVPAVRAAGWLCALCVLAAVPVGSYALVGGRTWAGIGHGAIAVPWVVPAGVGAVVGATTAGGGGRRLRMLVAVGVGVVLVLVFGFMFRAADPRFARLVHGWTGELSGGTVVRLLFGFVLVGAVAAGAALIVHSGWSEPDVEVGGGGPRLRTAEWAVPLGMVVALFAAFVSTQLGTLFGGRGHVMDLRGPDFAEYARTGFLLLFVVTASALGMVTALSRFAARESRRDRVLLRVLGGGLCGLTLVIVASALERMHLYVGAYGFSTERLLGYALEIWLGLLFVLVIGTGWRLRARWLPRAAAATAVLVLIGVAAVDPEAVMARTHIDRLERGYPVDTAFLGGLSTDAAEEVAKVPPQWRSCPREYRPAPRDPWYRFNLSRHRARDIDHDLLC